MARLAQNLEVREGGMVTILTPPSDFVPLRN